MTKEQARALYRKKRAGLDPQRRAAWDRAIACHILDTEPYARCRKLFAYYPLPGEINLLPLLEKALRQGKIVCLPVCSQAQAVKKLTFMRYSGKVKPGRYGIPVPDGEETVPPDGQTLCIVPGLACRPDGVRLGYGGGYYDRFLAGFPGFSLGAFYSGFIDEELPADAHDVPCGIIVTEDGIH